MGLPIVSVVPPDAELSEMSRIDPADRGKAPGRRGHDGKWAGYAFLKHQPTRQDAEQWDRDGSNVGLLSAHYPGLDIDVKSPRLREIVIEEALRLLGPAPIRRTVEPRALLMYCARDPFARAALVITQPSGLSHLVEFLGDKRQYLIAGTHPSGAQYRWDTPLDGQTLSPIDRDKVSAFFDALESRLRAAGLECERVGGGSGQQVMDAVQGSLVAPSMDELDRIVRLIPNDVERDGYIQLAHAVSAAAGQEDGLPVFSEWAGRWSGGTNDPDTVELDYRSVESLQHRVGWRWLIEQAETLGGYISAFDEFVADPDAPAPGKDQRLSQIPAEFTDDGVMQWSLQWVRDKLRYSAVNKSWMVWRGFRWQIDQTLQHEAIVGDLLRQLSGRLRDMAAGAPTVGETKMYEARAATLASSAARTNVITLLRSRVPCVPTDFDVDPMLLNTPGGVVDLRTGAISESTPEGMHSRAVRAAPTNGSMPLWTKFLHDSTGGDMDLIIYLQRLLGYSLTGDMREKSLTYVWGSESDTGKSTFIKTVTKLFGNYADTVSPDVFLTAKGDRIPAELARMPGVRLVTATEPPMEKSWDEPRVKSITGGDEIEVRLLYGQPFIYQPQFKLIVVGNQEPELRNVDSAMMRRINILPLNHPVPRGNQVADLAKRMIEEEGGAILQWMIDGCMSWQMHGLPLPASVLEKTREYVEDEDMLGQWVHEECVTGGEYESTRHELYEAFTAWGRARGLSPAGEKTFKRMMQPTARKYGLTDKQVGERRQRGYRGLQLRPMTEEF